MRITVLSQWYAPEPEAKSHILAKDLASRGHTVTAITGFPNYPQGKLYPGYSIRWRQWEVQDNVRILRVPLYPDHSRSALKRMANYGSFALSASTLGLALAGPADIVWVYHPPLTTSLPALAISSVYRIPFVYEIQDMWPETLAATGMATSRPMLGMAGALARCVYRGASAVTVISPGFKRNLMEKGVPADKIHIIPNWADEDVYHPCERDEVLARQAGLDDHFNVVYAGNLGAAQALGNVIAAAALVKDLADVQFVFIGDGVEEEQLKRAAAAAGLTNVRFLGRMQPQQMPAYYALADVLLVHLKDDPLFEITIPSKTIAYLASGRPILAAVKGDAAEVIHMASAGVACQPENPQALADGLRFLYGLSRHQREAMGTAGRQAYLSQYTRSVLVGRYENLFEQLVRQSKSTGPAQALPSSNFTYEISNLCKLRQAPARRAAGCPGVGRFVAAAGAAHGACIHKNR